MNTANKNAFTLSFQQIRFSTAIVSLLLSVFAFYLDDLINRDGIMYMEMVQAYLDGGLSSMAAIYDWPFFSMIIAWLSTSLSLPFELTAQILNSVFFVVFTDALLLISNRLLPNQRQLLIAAILILGFYAINEYRAYIIRDIGYWAFIMLALYQLISFTDKPGYVKGVLWQFCALLATAFRIEGLILMALLPLGILFYYPFKEGLKRLFQLNTLLIPGIFIIAILAISSSGWVEAFSKLDNYLAYLNTEALQVQLEQRLDIFESRILSPFSKDYSLLILFSGLFAMLLFKLVKGIGIGYGILTALSFNSNTPKPANRYNKLILWFVFSNVFILTAFLFRHYFVSSRYCTMAVAGIFILLLPYLTALIEQTWQRRNYWLTGFIGFIILAGLIDTFHTTNSKSYIKDIAIWASHNLQENDRILTDDEYIQYYFKREKTGLEIIYKPGSLKNYQNFDYIIVVEKARYQDLLEKLDKMPIQPIHSYSNERKNKASVYRVLSEK